jgi:hypothetical protein
MRFRDALHGGECVAKHFLPAPLVNGDDAANALKTLTPCEDPRTLGEAFAQHSRMKRKAYLAR